MIELRGEEDGLLTKRLLGAYDRAELEMDWCGWIVEHSRRYQPPRLEHEKKCSGRVQLYDAEFRSMFVQFDCGDAVFVSEDNVVIDFADRGNQGRLLAELCILLKTWAVHALPGWHLIVDGERRSTITSPSRLDCYIDHLEDICKEIA